MLNINLVGGSQPAKFEWLYKIHNESNWIIHDNHNWPWQANMTPQKLVTKESFVNKKNHGRYRCFSGESNMFWEIPMFSLYNKTSEKSPSFGCLASCSIAWHGGQCRDMWIMDDIHQSYHVTTPSQNTEYRIQKNGNPDAELRVG